MAFSITNGTTNPSAAYAVVPDGKSSKNAGALSSWLLRAMDPTLMTSHVVELYHLDAAGVITRGLRSIQAATTSGWDRSTFHPQLDSFRTPIGALASTLRCLVSSHSHSGGVEGTSDATKTASFLNSTGRCAFVGTHTGQCFHVVVHTPQLDHCEG